MANRRVAARAQWELPIRLISALVFGPAWQIAASLADSRLLPTVTAVVHAMLQQTLSGALPWNLAITLSRVAAAFTLSLLLGTALGVAMGCWRRLDLLLDNAVTVLLYLPALVVIVLIYVWFGLTEVAAIPAVAHSTSCRQRWSCCVRVRVPWIPDSPKWRRASACRVGEFCGM